MKAIIEFNLPEDNEEFKDVTNATEYKCALCEIRDNVRYIWKYRDLTPVADAVVDEIYEMVCEQIAEVGLE